MLNYNYDAGGSQENTMIHFSIKNGTAERHTSVCYYYYRRYLLFGLRRLHKFVFPVWLEIILQRNNKIFMNIRFLSARTREETALSKKHTDEENLLGNFFVNFLLSLMLV